MRLKLLTFNTLGTPFFAKDITRRYQKIAEIINKSDYDIVCLQELFTHHNYHVFRKSLKEFPYVVAKFSPFGPMGGLTIFSKIPISLERFHVYKYPTGTPIPFYTLLARSGILVCKLQDHPLFLATTHLTTDTVHNLTPQNKRFNLIRSQILQAADLFNYDENSIILAGDFNTGKGSMLYEEFLHVTGAKDAFAKSDEITYSPERTPYRFPAEEANRIDYIFYKEYTAKLKLSNLSHVFEPKATLSNGKQTYLSDHIGLSAVINLI